MTANPSDFVSVRYLVDDVDAAIDFYTTHLGFTVLSRPGPPFADVVRGNLRLLLSGPETLPHAPCRTADSRRPAAGTAST